MKHACDQFLEHLYEYLNSHDLTPEMCDHIKHHIELCRPCYTRLEFEQTLLKRLKASGCCVCPDTLKQKVKRLMEHF
jgi:hypothetical protein